MCDTKSNTFDFRIIAQASNFLFMRIKTCSNIHIAIKWIPNELFYIYEIREEYTFKMRILTMSLRIVYRKAVNDLATY